MLMTLPIAEYAERRQRLMAPLAADSALLLPAAELQIRNRDAEYPFRQNSDFHYLSGFPEPQALLLMLPDGCGGGRSVLFCLPRDPQKETWTGYRYGPEGALDQFGMDDAYSLQQLTEQMLLLLDGRTTLYLPFGSQQALAAYIDDWRQQIRHKHRSDQSLPQRLHDLDPLVHEMRLFKSPAEQQLMRRAGALSAAAHRQAMQRCRPGLMEYQLEACILFCFADQGARSPAYNSIVGGGANGCILHYTENRDVLKQGELVLIDAGAEVDGYAGDITRTFPVSGRFSEDQRALYQVVLAAQQAAIEQVKPGNHWNAPHEAAISVLTEGLLTLGLLEGVLQSLIDEEAYRPFYMHRTSHWLGLDVHDVGEYKQGDDWRAFEPGMVLTVEPGLYIAADCDSVDVRWRGIGIRIEDDVLVTEHGCEVLSAGVPKTVDEIEALMALGSEALMALGSEALMVLGSSVDS